MEIQYLTYHNLINRINSISRQCGDPNLCEYCIIFIHDKIIINNSHYSMILNFNAILDVKSYTEIRKYMTLKMSNVICKIYRGGWESQNHDYYCWNVPISFKNEDIIDFWRYDELKKHPEIINRILLSRLSYAGKPSETDKFQGFWMGDVRFIYPN